METFKLINRVRDELRVTAFPPGESVNRVRGFMDGWRFKCNERIVASIERNGLDYSDDNIKKALLNEAESDFYYRFEKDWVGDSL